ncbi:MAG: carbohydrate porin [Verrucomicrobiota bacterium]
MKWYRILIPRLLFFYLAVSICSAAPPTVLYTDSLGRIVQVPTNDVPPELLPAAGTRQIPESTRGVKLRTDRETNAPCQWFPARQPRLMSYLASNDEFGNTAIRPDPLIRSTPLDAVVQGGKYWLSDYGFRYKLDHTATYVSLTDVTKGDSTLAYYTFDFKSKWAIFNTGWITSQVEYKTGLGPIGDTQDAKSNLGTTTNPTGIWSSHNGWRVPELAWQQALLDGQIVIVAGMVSQGNYFDSNAYAGSGRGQFINSGLIDSMVVPLPSYNAGFNVQWQPLEDWYGMIGYTAGGATAGTAAWNEFSSDPWTVLGEFGYAPDNFLGIGPGVYRVQPFIAEADGWTQGGLGFNLQQQLGKDSPFGWYGRYGYGGSHVVNGAQQQLGTGFVVQAPFKHLLMQRTSNDFLGVGFVWSQPMATTKPIIHENEYVFEITYALQLTPTAKLQPDVQYILDPTHNASPNAAVVQLQLDLKW